jgi:hypothetical protein
MENLSLLAFWYVASMIITAITMMAVVRLDKGSYLPIDGQPQWGVKLVYVLLCIPPLNVLTLFFIAYTAVMKYAAYCMDPICLHRHWWFSWDITHAKLGEQIKGKITVWTMVGRREFDFMTGLRVVAKNVLQSKDIAYSAYDPILVSSQTNAIHLVIVNPIKHAMFRRAVEQFRRDVLAEAQDIMTEAVLDAASHCEALRTAIANMSTKGARAHMTLRAEQSSLVTPSHILIATKCILGEPTSYIVATAHSLEKGYDQDVYSTYLTYSVAGSDQRMRMRLFNTREAIKPIPSTLLGLPVKQLPDSVRAE